MARVEVRKVRWWSCLRCQEWDIGFGLMEPELEGCTHSKGHWWVHQGASVLVVRVKALSEWATR